MPMKLIKEVLNALGDNTMVMNWKAQHGKDVNSLLIDILG